jgi:hypothetical protein
MAQQRHFRDYAQYLFYELLGFPPNAPICYTDGMTKLLEQAIHRLRQLPAAMQDNAARAVILQLEEEPEPGDREAVAAGRNDFENGDFVTLDQWRHEIGIRNN